MASVGLYLGHMYSSTYIHRFSERLKVHVYFVTRFPSHQIQYCFISNKIIYAVFSLLCRIYLIRFSCRHVATLWERGVMKPNWFFEGNKYAADLKMGGSRTIASYSSRQPPTVKQEQDSSGFFWLRHISHFFQNLKIILLRSGGGLISWFIP